ncbi:unnamed protein product [Prorocentrum cordatum]|uniref:RING-type domain-containing protein n=1 Tax=Prorocentrum cordatum TaxID=2364126 RepID=A0ABN9TBC7_9DINO|nr:unnamed protein product [Polarella glacialis]
MATSATSVSTLVPAAATPAALFSSCVKSVAGKLDLWRVYLDQCPECGCVHGGGVAGTGTRPERHIYEYTRGVPDDLLCPLCGEVFQAPVKIPCGHHYCNICVRMLLTRTSGKVACPLDGQAITRFALQPAGPQVLEGVGSLWIRCPVCKEEVRKSQLDLHLQDPVCMVETPAAYGAILRPFYLSCPLSTFTVGELNGSSSLIRFYRRLGPDALKRFVLTMDSFIVLPDPKMGFQPHTEDDAQAFRRNGGYFVAWWIHPSFRPEVWWRTGEDGDGDGDTAGSPAPPSPASGAGSTGDGAGFLRGHDCSAEPWHESSFAHTWSAVRKPESPRYICCLRDLRGEDLPMLEGFRKEVLRFLKDNFLADESRVSIFCHYPASARYSTLHFHIIWEGEQRFQFEKYARKLERPHQLSRQFSLGEIIRLLRADPMHFETCTLSYFLGDKADLMDPISAFFGCSPHKYLRDFTFHWDPCAVASHQAVQATGAASLRDGPDPRGGTGLGAAATLEGGVVAAGSGGAMLPGAEERLSLQLGELARALEGVRKTVEALAAASEEQARGQRWEQSGAYKLAISTPGGRGGAALPWAAAGAAAGALLALLAAAGVGARPAVATMGGNLGDAARMGEDPDELAKYRKETHVNIQRLGNVYLASKQADRADPEMASEFEVVKFMMSASKGIDQVNDKRDNMFMEPELHAARDAELLAHIGKIAQSIDTVSDSKEAAHEKLNHIMTANNFHDYHLKHIIDQQMAGFPQPGPPPMMQAAGSEAQMQHHAGGSIGAHADSGSGSRAAAPTGPLGLATAAPAPAGSRRRDAPTAASNCGTVSGWAAAAAVSAPAPMAAADGGGAGAAEAAKKATEEAPNQPAVKAEKPGRAKNEAVPSCRRGCRGTSLEEMHDRSEVYQESRSVEPQRESSGLMRQVVRACVGKCLAIDSPAKLSQQPETHRLNPVQTEGRNYAR